MMTTNWLTALRRNAILRRGRRSRRRFDHWLPGPSAHVETLEERTLLSAGLAISSFGLMSDTGTAGNGVTSDPRLVGSVTSNGPPSDVTVEFDYDGDGMADASTWTDSNGDFLYDPAMEFSPGPITVLARASEIDWGSMETVYSGWVVLSFTWQYDGPAPVVESLDVVNPIGPAWPNYTVDGLVGGAVQADVGLDMLSVEFDYNGDGIPDDYAMVDGDGTYVHDVGLMLSYGRHTIRARAVGTATFTADTVIGDWASLTFEYVAPPVITSFTVVNHGNGWWTLQGTVEFFDPELLTVFFGGVYEGSASVESDGSFLIAVQVFEEGYISAETIDEWGRPSGAVYEYIG